MCPQDLQKRVSAHRAGRRAQWHCQHFISDGIVTVHVLSQGVQSFSLTGPATLLPAADFVEHGDALRNLA